MIERREQSNGTAIRSQGRAQLSETPPGHSCVRQRHGLAPLCSGEAAHGEGIALLRPAKAWHLYPFRGEARAWPSSALRGNGKARLGKATAMEGKAEHIESEQRQSESKRRQATL